MTAGAGARGSYNPSSDEFNAKYGRLGGVFTCRFLWFLCLIAGESIENLNPDFEFRDERGTLLLPMREGSTNSSMT